MALPIVEHYIQLKNETVSLFVRHKRLFLASIVISVFLVLFGIWAMRVRTNILAGMNSPHKNSSNEVTLAVITPISSPSAYTGILGTSDDMNLTDVQVTDYPPITPYPIITQNPLPTPPPYQAPITISNTSSNSNSSGNPNCTTAGGVPNAWYSDVYPASPVSVAAGSTVTYSVILRDCNKNTVSVSDTLKISLNSGSSSTQVNGNNLPYTITTQNGQTSFTVLSETAQTVSLNVQDTTNGFTVTDTNNHNPSVTFTGNASGNSTCTTSVGVPNAWYSDVYPNPPITTTTGSVTLQVIIRDCNKNTTSVSDTLNISLSSGDSGTQVNGNSLPYSLSAQNGQASFSVSSQVNGTVTLAIQDTTSSFTITDPNNHNPSISFNGSSTSTPTPTPATTDTPTPTPATAATPTTALTPTPTSSNTPTPTPNPTP